MQEKVGLNQDHETTLIMLVWNSVKLKSLFPMQTGWSRMLKFGVSRKKVLLVLIEVELQRMYKKFEVK